MAFFDEFKQKVNKAAQSVSNKTKDNMEISRITSASKNIDGEIESLLMQIGCAYVESNGADSENLSALAARVGELRERQAELERQKQQIKNRNLCPGCGLAFPKGARYCPNCGVKLPEPEPEPEEESAEEAPEAEAEAVVEDEIEVEAEELEPEEAEEEEAEEEEPEAEAEEEKAADAEENAGE